MTLTDTRYRPQFPIRVASLNCWNSSPLIYQADGFTNDGRSVFVYYRRPWFTVGIGTTNDAAVAADTYISNDRPDHDPSTIDLATLKAWTEGVFIWPDRIDGYANEPDGPR
jgi:hypothetical protein